VRRSDWKHLKHGKILVKNDGKKKSESKKKK
jgi:hypothetical protein